MARVQPPPNTTWNNYIESQANASADQSIEARRLIKKNIKLGMIASIERQAGGNTASPSYRPYNKYVPPGTVSPAIGRPFLLSDVVMRGEILLENGNTLATEEPRGLETE